ncbi:MAG: ATP-binding cassette domain-containing protein [Puniceicoccales bacterium]|nr:ATP-binding cassette domain-containing protein [Puniceicoccales bacterium]
MEEEAVLKLQDLAVSYGDGKDVISSITLSVAVGEFAIVVGPNGGGKSTLLGAIAGTLRAHRGRIAIGGVENNFHRVCCVFQNPTVGTVGNFTVFENMALAWRRHRWRLPLPALTARRKKIFCDRLAALSMGLEDRGDDPARVLSGGQRQALSLAMATLRDCDVLLLDEITAALDPLASARVMDLAESIVRQNSCACLAVTHSLQQAISYGDSVIAIGGGAMVAKFSAVEKSTMSVADLLAHFEFPFANGQSAPQ